MRSCAGCTASSSRIAPSSVRSSLTGHPVRSSYTTPSGGHCKTDRSEHRTHRPARSRARRDSRIAASPRPVTSWRGSSRRGAGPPSHHDPVRDQLAKLLRQTAVVRPRAVAGSLRGRGRSFAPHRAPGARPARTCAAARRSLRGLGPARTLLLAHAMARVALAPDARDIHALGTLGLDPARLLVRARMRRPP